MMGWKLACSTNSSDIEVISSPGCGGGKGSSASESKSVKIKTEDDPFKGGPTKSHTVEEKPNAYREE